MVLYLYSCLCLHAVGLNHREHGPFQHSLSNAYCVVLNNVSIINTPTAFIKAIKHIKAVGVLIVPITYLA